MFCMVDEFLKLKSHLYIAVLKALLNILKNPASIRSVISFPCKAAKLLFRKHLFSAESWKCS